MDRFEIYEALLEKLRNGETVALRMRMDGEGKFKDFHGEREILSLWEFLENAGNTLHEGIVFRAMDARESVVSEMV